MIVEELVAKLGLDIDELGFSRAEAVLAKLRLGYVAFGTAAVGALAVGAAALIKSTADAGDHARKLSQSTGVNSIALQELAYSFKLADVSSEEMGQALGHLAKTGVKDVRGEMLRLADVFAKMPNDGERVKLAMEKFGRAGRKMIPGLAGGRKELEALMEEAHEFGVVIGEEDQKAAEDFNDQLTRLGSAFAGIRNRIGLGLIRPLTAAVVGFRKLILEMRTGTPWVHTVTLALRTFAFVLGGAVLAALVLNASAVATAVSWYVALGIASTVAAVKAAAAWLVAAAPAILLVAAFTALLLILDDVRGFLEGEDSLIGALGPKWSAFLDRFLVGNAEDPWWLAAIKSAVLNMRVLAAMLQDFEGTLGGVGKALRNATGLDIFETGGTDNSATGAAVRSASQDADVSAFRASHRSLYDTMTGPASMERPWMPAGPVQQKGGVTVQAPVTMHIMAGPNATPAAIADEVAKRFDAHHTAKLREAAAGIP